VITAAVFFDVGETLLHPHPTFPELFALVLRREGHPVDVETVRERSMIVFERFAHAARTKELWTTTPEKSRTFWHDVYSILLRDLQIPDENDLVDRVYAEFTDMANYALFDDVVPALEALRGAGLRLGIVSNFEEWLERLLVHLGVTRFFEVRVISGVEGVEKPDPAIFWLAMERAGVTPAQSVYVGDNPELDVEAATAAGMSAILLDRRDRFPDAPEPRITSMAELPAVLGVAA
jgi:putative hydrolase of the HAD superfamily